MLLVAIKFGRTLAQNILFVSRESNKTSYTEHKEHCNISSPFYYLGLTLIPAWINNHAQSKVWDGITYSFLNFNGATVEV